MQKFFKIKSDLANYEIFDCTEAGKIADNLKKRLCDEGWYSNLKRYTFKHDRIIFSRESSPGNCNLSQHDGKHFLNIIYADYLHGAKLQEWYNALPPHCKKPLNPKCVALCARR